MLQNVSRFFRRQWLLVIIVLIGLALRLYRLNDMASYDFDQEYNTTFVLDVVKVYPLRYVGQGLSVQGLFMGPYYFYYLVPFYLLFGLNPVGGAFGSVMLGILTILAYFFVGKSLFNEKAGYLAAGIRALGFYAIQSDWRAIPSESSDLIVIVSWWLLYQLWQSKGTTNKPYLPALCACFGLYSSFHPVQFPFILISLLLITLIWRLRFSLKIWFTSILCFIAGVLPLLMFEYWRKWAMVHLILNAATNSDSGSASSITAVRVAEVVKIVLDFWSELISVPKSWMALSAVTLVTAIVIISRQKTLHTKLWFHLSALATTIIIFMIYYSVLPFHVSDYYLRGIQAVLVVYLAAALSYMMSAFKGKGAYAVYLILLFLIWKNGTALLERWSDTNLRNLAQKQAAIDTILQQAHGQPFQVSYITEPGWQFGFKSLFRLKGQEPGGIGPVYSIVSPASMISSDEIDFYSGGIGVIYPKN